MKRLAFVVAIAVLVVVWVAAVRSVPPCKPGDPDIEIGGMMMAGCHHHSSGHHADRPS